MGTWSHENCNKGDGCSNQEQRSLDRAMQPPPTEQKLPATSMSRRDYFVVCKKLQMKMSQVDLVEDYEPKPHTNQNDVK